MKLLHLGYFLSQIALKDVRSQSVCSPEIPHKVFETPIVK